MISQHELQPLADASTLFMETRAIIARRLASGEATESGLLDAKLLIRSTCSCEDSRAFWDELAAAMKAVRAAKRKREALAADSGDWPRPFVLWGKRIALELYGARIAIARLLSGGATIGHLRRR